MVPICFTWLKLDTIQPPQHPKELQQRYLLPIPNAKNPTLLTMKTTICLIKGWTSLRKNPTLTWMLAEPPARGFLHLHLTDLLPSLFQPNPICVGIVTARPCQNTGPCRSCMSQLLVDALLIRLLFCFFIRLTPIHSLLRRY